MRKPGKNVNPTKETVEAYCACFDPQAWCYANCYGNSAGQSYAMQYYDRFTSVPSTTTYY